MKRPWYKKRRWAAIGILLIFTIIILILWTNAQIHFTLQDDLLITHTPSIAYIQTTNNATTPVTIQTSIETYRFCTFTCTYSVGFSTQTAQEASTVVLYRLQSSQPSLNHSFMLPTPSYGFGQQYFTFFSQCTIKPGFFCPSQPLPVNQSSLIILSFNASREEQEIIRRKSEFDARLAEYEDNIRSEQMLQRLARVWPISYIHATNASVVRWAQLFWNQSKYREFAAVVTPLSYNSSQQRQEVVAAIVQYNLMVEHISQLQKNRTVQDYLSMRNSLGWFLPTMARAVSRVNEYISNPYTTNATTVLTAIETIYNQTAAFSQKYAQAKIVADEIKVALPLIKTPIQFPATQVCELHQQALAHNAFLATAIENNQTIDVIDFSQITTNLSENTSAYLPTISLCEPDSSTQQVSLISTTLTKVPQSILTQQPQSTWQPLANATALCCTAYCQPCTSSRPPILFIHGHAFNEKNNPLYSLEAFKEMASVLEHDGYLNAGIYTANPVPITWPFTTRASFYFIRTYDLGEYQISIQKSERIENYALRLNEILEDVKLKSGSPQVIIVAHSMGGLVVREYEHLFGNSSINKVITINTPHQGIEGRTAAVCGLLGSSKECDDMKVNSTFLRRLPRVKGQWHVIASSGCIVDQEPSDGVVYVKNSYLDGAASYTVINGTCTDVLTSDLHTQALLDTQVIEKIREIVNTQS